MCRVYKTGKLTDSPLFLPHGSITSKMSYVSFHFSL